MAQVKYGNIIKSCIDEEEYQENNNYDGYLRSLSEEEEEEDDSCNSIGVNSSEDEDFIEDVNSSSCSLNSSLSSNSSNSSLFDMSSLISHLPLKRGLSKHYEGKSQSFTSLSSVKGLEDLIKPENPLNKKIKSSKSYSWGMMNSSKIIKKKSSKGSLSSSLRNLKRHDSFFRGKPHFPTQRFATRGLETAG